MTTIYNLDEICALSSGILMAALPNRARFLSEFSALLSAFEAEPPIETYDDLILVETMELAADVCRFCAVYNEDIRDDLVLSNSYRDVNSLGALLSLFSPHKSDPTCFAAKQQPGGEVPWLLEVAFQKNLAALDENSQEVFQLIENVDAYLKKIAPPKIELWKIRDVPEMEFKRFQVEFKDLYRQAGSDEALAFLNAQKNPDVETTFSRYLRYRFPPK